MVNIRRPWFSQSVPEGGAIVDFAAEQRRRVAGEYNDQLVALNTEWLRVVGVVLAHGPIRRLNLGNNQIAYTTRSRPTSFSLTDPESRDVYNYQGTGMVYGVLDPEAAEAIEMVRGLEIASRRGNVDTHPSSFGLLAHGIGSGTVALCAQLFSPEVPPGSLADRMLFYQVTPPTEIGIGQIEAKINEQGAYGATEYFRGAAIAHYMAMNAIATILEPPLPTPPPLAQA